MDSSQQFSETVFTGDELLHMRGQQAEEFMRFIESDDQYFLTLLTNIKDTLTKEMLDLKPSEHERFTVLKAQIDCLYEPIKRVLQDIEVGQIAWRRMNGEAVDNEKGIL